MNLVELIEIAPAKHRESLLEEHRRMMAELERQTHENRLLREELRLALLSKYGRKGEALSDEQRDLFEGEPGVCEAEVGKEAARPEAEKKPQRTRKSHPGRAELPAHLPRHEEIVKVEGEERICPCCGKERCVVGHETREILEVVPAKYFVRVLKREKLACREHPEGGVAVASAVGPKIVEKGKLSDRMVVDVVLKKYGQHLPLYRQEAVLMRDFEIGLSRKTLCDAVMAAGSLLEAVSREMRRDLLEGGYIQADETPVGVQGGSAKGRNHLGYVFEYSRPRGPCVFDFRMGRAREGPREFLANYAGLLQTDGYAGYEKVGGSALVRAGCWAHARRKFNDALKLDPTNEDAREVIGLIAKLYAVEKKARDQDFTPQSRKELRRERSTPVIEEIQTKVMEIRSKILPGSKLAKACNYMQGQWGKLMRFLEHGELEIDNNLCENAIRPLALGRKNWLHIGDEKAGPRIAAILSVMETCRRLGINERAYMEDILPRIGNHPTRRVAELTPMAWLSARN